MRTCLSACLGLALAAACTTDRRLLTVHLADYADKASSNRLRIEMPRGEAPLYAEPTPVLDERDFRSVSFGDTTDDPTITANRPSTKLRTALRLLKGRQPLTANCEPRTANQSFPSVRRTILTSPRIARSDIDPNGSSVVR
jgi:hypothetical protein